MYAGDRKIKCSVLVSCLLAYMDALHNGSSIDQTITATLMRTMETYVSLLESQKESVSDTGVAMTSSYAFGNQPDWSFLEDVVWR